MKSIEEYMEVYDGDFNSKFSRVLAGAGILLWFSGWLCLLWYLPDEPIKNWLGDRQFANWATVLIVVLLIYYGSESFTLTFGSGFFLLGSLLGVSWLIFNSSLDLIALTGSLLGSGAFLLILSRVISGSLKNIYRELTFLPLLPVWIIYHLYRWLGLSF